MKTGMTNQISRSIDGDLLVTVAERQARRLTRDVVVLVLYLTGAIGGMLGFVVL